MATIILRVQGSVVNRYRETCKKEGNNLDAYCSCSASADGQDCKHRFAILGAETEGMVSGNEVQVQTVATWLSGSDVARNKGAPRRRERS